MTYTLINSFCTSFFIGELELKLLHEHNYGPKHEVTCEFNFEVLDEPQLGIKFFNFLSSCRRKGSRSDSDFVILEIY